MATKEKPAKATTFSYLSDRFAAGAARVNGGEYPDIDIAVVKATNHDLAPPKAKHVRTLRETVAGAPTRKKIVYLIHDLYERMKGAGDDWLVVMKTLMVFHQLMKSDGEGTFKLEMIKYKERRKLPALLRMDNFTDKTTKESWDYSGYIRVYSIYMDERLEVFQTIKFDVEKSVGGGDTKLKSAPTHELLDHLPRIQRLLNRVLACLPEGASTTSPVIIESLKWVLTECFRIYRAISEGVINLADQFFEMDRIDARKGLEMYREAIDSTERLQSYFNSIQSIPAGRQFTFPQLQPPPADFMDQMEEYVKGQGSEAPKQAPVAGRVPRSVPVAAALSNNSNDQGKDEIPDLLGDAFDEAPKDNASATDSDFWNLPKQNDPFGEPAFASIRSQSSERSTPTPGPPSVQPNPQSANPTASILDDFLDLSINPTPPQQPQNDFGAFGGPVASAPPPFEHQQPGGFNQPPMEHMSGFGQPAQPIQQPHTQPDGGNPFGSGAFGPSVSAGGFGEQAPLNNAPVMNSGFQQPPITNQGNAYPGMSGANQMAGNPNPGMGGVGMAGPYGGVNSNMGQQSNPRRVSDPFTDISADLGIRSGNPSPVVGAPMRPNFAPEAQSGNPFGTDGGQFGNQQTTAGAAGGQNFSFF
ncbi:hypothetical protein BSKO_06364 [Bryopsis sp. KO-2023]|nr:hypothetical protein BSKO_06364 [Bryopsis sp. KO-2023]